MFFKMNKAFPTVYNNTAVVPRDLIASLPANPMATDEMFGEVAKGSQFLPRLQLFTASTKECKAGKIGMNLYALVVAKDQFKIFGKTVNVVPYAWRPKAMQIVSDGSIITEYDPKSEAFGKIAAKSEIKDSGCMFGPEFLVFIPEIARWASFYMASKSARVEAPNLKEKMDEGVPATLDSKFVQTKKYSWQAPIVTACNDPVEVPTDEAVLAEVTKFNNPPKNEVEPAEPITRDR